CFAALELPQSRRDDRSSGHLAGFSGRAKAITTFDSHLLLGSLRGRLIQKEQRPICPSIHARRWFCSSTAPTSTPPARPSASTSITVACWPSSTARPTCCAP